MIPGARIQAAIELLSGIDAGAAPADQIISAYFRRRRYAGSGDRRAVRERVYGLLRRRGRLDWRIAGANEGPITEPRSRVVAGLALIDRAGPEEIDALFSGQGHAPAPLSRSERALAALEPPLESPGMPPWAALEYPRWMDPSLARRWGGDLAREMAALNEPAPVDLRVNTLKGGREAALQSLAGDGIPARPTPLSPIGLRLEEHINLKAASAFTNGLTEVQDEGSQIIALLCGCRPGMMVADFCAGAGGKTLALAAVMEGRGRLLALDVSEARLKRMATRAERAGAAFIEARVLAADAGSWIAARGQTCDRVLIDAPCSGSGAWRRAPEARWRLAPQDLENLLAEQAAILDAAARLVKPAGRLVYATCSVLGEENEDQVDRFLGRHPGFAVLPVDGVWAETIGKGCPAEGAYINLSPAGTGTDGFFAAVLERER